MEQNYQIDDLDRKILRELYKDARVSFVDIAKKLSVSGGTIHQRVNKLKINGVLIGFGPTLNEQKFGLLVSSIIGINLKNAKDCQKVIESLEKFPEVTEAFYTTGSYALIIKIVTRDILSFRDFLMEKLQSIAEIQSTESFICLDQPIRRNIKIF